MFNRLWIFFCFCIYFSQTNINFNYQSQYGNGSNVDDFTQTTSPYYYFENLLDINFNYNSIYFHTQLEYSNSPIYGKDIIHPKQVPTTYFIEYSNSDLMLKWGHIQTLYGYGLNINMFHDQTIDFNNRIRGVEFKYSPSDYLDLFFVSGEGNFGTKSKGDLRVNDLFFKNNIKTYGAQFYTNLGDMSISMADKVTYYDGGIYSNLINSDSRLSVDLQDYLFSDFDIWNLDSRVELNGINFSYSKTLGDFDIYIENQSNNYNKILRKDEDINGYLNYFSLSGDISDISILYEHKDYKMLYYMPIYSSPPLVYGETTSVLMSRIQHNVDFSDEIGHQFEARFNLLDLDFLMNLSFGMKHQGVRNWNDFEMDDDFNITYGTYSKPPTSQALTDMDFLDEDFRAHKPFRDFYIEASGWRDSDKFSYNFITPTLRYYKIGYGSQYSYDDASGKNYESYTIPTQFVFEFNNQNSITVYYEYQKTNNLQTAFSFEDDGTIIPDYEYDTYKYNYSSISYHINNFGSITYFLDKEYINYWIDDSNKKNSWKGVELSLELSSSMHLSIFKGSQKGGLVCANGVCAVQPSFEDGIKITFRALF
tara:strand:+ start:2984 stop:4759 length:1776 start_codon:yes stop_codon:yes gene_type:complete